MKKIMFISVLVAIFTACNNKEKDLVIENKETIETVSNKVLEKFAKTLAVVLQENRESRELIKKEALKKIDYDYDVLYMLVKDLDLGMGQSL